MNDVKWQRKYSMSSAGRARLHFPGRLVALWGRLSTLYWMVSSLATADCCDLDTSSWLADTLRAACSSRATRLTFQKRGWLCEKSFKNSIMTFVPSNGIQLCEKQDKVFPPEVSSDIFFPKVSWILHFPRCIIAVSRHSLSSCIDFCLGLNFGFRLEKWGRWNKDFYKWYYGMFLYFCIAFVLYCSGLDKNVRFLWENNFSNIPLNPKWICKKKKKKMQEE